MLRHNNTKVRISACQGLVLNQAYDSIALLLYKSTRDPENKIKNEALKSLVYLGPQGITAIKNQMKNKKHSQTSLYVISSAVAAKPSQESVQFLLSLYKTAVKDNDKGKIETIAKNVVKGDDNKLDPIIAMLLESDDYLIRIGAIMSIYRIKKSSLWLKVKELSENDPIKQVKLNAKKFLDLKKL